MTPDPRHRPWTPYDDAWLLGWCEMARELGHTLSHTVARAALKLDRPRAAVPARVALLQLWDVTENAE